MGLLFASDVKWLYANGFMSYGSPLVNGIERFDDMRFVAALENHNKALHPNVAGPDPEQLMNLFRGLSNRGLASVFVRYDTKDASWVATCFDLFDADKGCYVQFSADSGHAQDAVQALLGKIEAYQSGGQDD